MRAEGSTRLRCRRRSGRRPPPCSVQAEGTRSTPRLILTLNSLHFTNTTSRSTRICPFLVPLVSVVVLLSGHSGNRSRNFARIGKKHGVAKDIWRDREHRLGQRKDAGCIRETAGSTLDL